MYRDGRDVDVLLFVEHRDRELDLVAALARRLKRDHHLTVAVASRLFDAWSAPIVVRPRVIVGTSTKRDPCWLASMFDAMYGDGVRHVCLNWEQILSPLNAALRPPEGRLTRERIHHLAWGDAFARFLVEHGVAADHVTVTGKPSFALLEAKASRRAEVKRRLAARHGLDADRRWILVPTTCHYAFFSDARLRRRAGRDGRLAILKEVRAYVRTTLDAILSWIDAYGPEARRTGTTIVLRPHPFVTEAQHRQRFRALTGGVPEHVHITKAATAYDWLVASDACFTNYSSVALDANGLGWPAYLLEPAPFPSCLETEWYGQLPRIRTQDAFAAAVTAPVAVPPAAGFLRHAARRDDPIDATVQLIAKLARDARGERASRVSGSRALAAHPRHAVASAGRRVIEACGLTRRLQPGYADDAFTAADVGRRLAGDDADVWT